MSAVGEVVWVPSEDALDVVTALSGSGPAYFFLLAELHGAGGPATRTGARRRRGASRVATLHGAGLLAHARDGDLARLRAEVTSRGGTTEAALRVLDRGGPARHRGRALAAATARRRELAAPQFEPLR